MFHIVERILNMLNNKAVVETWFPVPIYTANLSDKFKTQNQKFYEKGLYYKENIEQKVSWKCDTYTSLNSVFLGDEPIFSDLIQEITNCVLDFSFLFGVKKDMKAICNDAWINIASPGQFQEVHIHPNSHFSIVYYVKAPENCGAINFYSYDAHSDMFPIPVDGKTPMAFKVCNYVPTESQLLIFRSNLKHGVNKNFSSEDRVSISMNFTIT